MAPLESTIEAYLVKRVREAGGFIRKLDARVSAHWADRLVLLPYRTPFLVELKRPRGGRLSDGQKEMRDKLQRIGHDVQILWTKDMIDEFIDRYAPKI